MVATIGNTAVAQVTASVSLKFQFIHSPGAGIGVLVGDRRNDASGFAINTVQFGGTSLSLVQYTTVGDVASWCRISFWRVDHPGGSSTVTATLFVEAGTTINGMAVIAFDINNATSGPGMIHNSTIASSDSDQTLSATLTTSIPNALIVGAFSRPTGTTLTTNTAASPLIEFLDTPIGTIGSGVNVMMTAASYQKTVSGAEVYTMFANGVGSRIAAMFLAIAPEEALPSTLTTSSLLLLGGLGGIPIIIPHGQ